MRRALCILMLILGLFVAGCDLFGSDKEGGIEKEGQGGDETVVVDEP